MTRAGRKRKQGDREPNGRLRPASNEPDFGSPRPAWHRPVIYEETRQAGVKRARNPAECLLDVLLDDGMLGEGRDAWTRYSAGIWLRGLHERAISGRVTATYQPPSDSSEMGPGQVLALKRLRRVMFALGADWHIVRRICIEGLAPISEAITQEALDRLVKHQT